MKKVYRVERQSKTGELSPVDNRLYDKKCYADASLRNNYCRGVKDPSYVVVEYVLGVKLNVHS